MARIRNLKPDFFTDEDLGCLPRDARLLYAGLWCHVDRDGIAEYRPQKLRIQIFPYDDDITVPVFETLCEILQDPKIPHRKEKRFIDIYEAAGEKYIRVINLGKHQKFHKDEKSKGLPIPNQANRVPAGCQQGADGKPLENKESRPAGCQQGASRPDSGNLKSETETEGASVLDLENKDVKHSTLRTSPSALNAYPSGVVTPRAMIALSTHVKDTLVSICRDSAPVMLREGLEDGGIDAALEQYPLTDQQQIPRALKNYIARCRVEKTELRYVRSLPSFIRPSHDHPLGFWRNCADDQPLGGGDGVAREGLLTKLKNRVNNCAPMLTPDEERVFRAIGVSWADLQARVLAGESLDALSEGK